jgi:3-deoxy-D-manno-octulosonic-acid transferase
MLRIYNITIYLYILLVRIHSLINKKSRQWVNGRKNLFKNLITTLSNEKNIIWFHCASLGEYEQAKELIIKYKEEYKEDKILVTFFSPSGYKNIKKNNTIDWIFYIPIDTRKNARKFINLIKPDKVFFIKSEFWYNYMNILAEKNIPLYHISSVFRKNDFAIKSSFSARVLSQSEHFFVQDEESKLALQSININQVTITGDTRIDSILSDIKVSQEDNTIKYFCKEKPVIIFSSIWSEDEHIVLNYIRSHNNYKYIIAPHEISYCKEIIKKLDPITYSNFNKEAKKDILLIDNIGVLKHIYKYCSIAYVGGGFGDGIHNILEASANGIPVIIGPNYLKFVEAFELISINAAFSIRNINEFKIAVNKIEESFKKEHVLNYILKKSGSVKKIIEKISAKENLLD